MGIRNPKDEIKLGLLYKRLTKYMNLPLGSELISGERSIVHNDHYGSSKYFKKCRMASYHGKLERVQAGALVLASY